MLVKVFSLIVVTFVLWMTVSNKVVNSAVDVKPYRDSFDVLRSMAMPHLEILGTIYDAEQARIQHGRNLTAVSIYMQGKFLSRYGHDANCFANIGAMSGRFWASPYFIYLKSDTSDNMHIVCYKSRYDVVSGTQYIVDL